MFPYGFLVLLTTTSSPTFTGEFPPPPDVLIGKGYLIQLHSPVSDFTVPLMILGSGLGNLSRKASGMGIGNGVFYPIVGFATCMAFIYKSFGDLLVNYSKEPELSFVQRNGTYFTLDGRIFCINGWNSYYLMDHAVDEYTRPKVTAMLQARSKIGLIVCRTWAFNDGRYNSLQISPGQYDDHVFKVLLIGGIPIAMPTVLSVTMAISSHSLSVRIELHLAATNCIWPLRIPLGRIELHLAATNSSWPRRITLGRVELHLAATNSSWPHRIAFGCYEFLLAASNCTWPHRIALGRYDFLLAALNCTWPLQIPLGRIELHLTASNCIWPLQSALGRIVTHL
ncbi:hypothetical protein C3L33_23494, partial [Rhododendron williamsianum]